ncbi:isocitrate dehydrogenase, NAD-dependent [Synergistales bacterium]|nr:isocitrate dehydrogenase, NAD-dependent [Synergistales bacterium]
MKIGVLKGDGIGPELVEATLFVLDACKVGLEWVDIPIANEALVKYNHPIPQESLATIRELKVAIKGPISVDKMKGRITCVHKDGSAHTYPSFNNAIRRELGLFVCPRPSKGIPGISDPLHETMDLIIMREITEDAYSAIEHRIGNVAAECVKLCTREAVERVTRYSFDYARKNKRKKVTCVHKANAISITDGFFLECFRDVAKTYPDIESDDYFVDAATYYFVKRPEMFDVIVTTNQYGDILSDLGAALMGSLGLGPGGNIGTEAAVFEACHGSAPDIAGKGIANPTSLILSGVMMLRHIGVYEMADRIEKAVRETLISGVRTPDIGGTSGTMEFARNVVSRLG